jgi:hypothetical protein
MRGRRRARLVVCLALLASLVPCFAGSCRTARALAAAGTPHQALNPAAAPATGTTPATPTPSLATLPPPLATLGPPATGPADLIGAGGSEVTVIPPIAQASMSAAPTMTVLSLLGVATPTPTPGLAPDRARGPAAAAGAGLMGRLGQALRLPPLPDGWPWGLLLILVVASLLRASWRGRVAWPW